MRISSMYLLLILFLPLPILAQSIDDSHKPLLQKGASKFQPLLEAGKKSNSDALIVIEEGEEVVNYQKSSGPELMNTMSVTKPVVALAIAHLLSENKIDSLDTPVAKFFPEWRQGQKENITIRHLMNHTSGLQNVSNAREEIHPSPNILKLGLSASVVDSPGTKISYNNKAVNILPGIVEEVTGKPIDEYLSDNLFNEMNIDKFNWRTDEAGNRFGMSGLKLQADDLASLGQLVLQKGEWNGKQLIDQKWVEELVEQGHPDSKTFGLLWMRISEDTKLTIDDEQIDVLKEEEINNDMINVVREIKGEYESQGAIVEALWSKFNSKKELMEFRKATLGQGISPWKKSSSDNIIGYKASGDFGQYLVIYPDQEVVAVRMIKPSEDYNHKTDNFGSFPQMVYKLAEK